MVGALGRQSGRLVVLPPKSATSRRLVHLVVSTVDTLGTHLAAQAEERLGMGGLYDDQGFLFATPTGGSLDPDVLTIIWRKLCRDLGVS